MTARISKGGLSNAEKSAPRGGMERILVLLAEKPPSVTDIAHDLKISQATADGPLRYMVDLDDVHRMEETEENGWMLWCSAAKKATWQKLRSTPGFKGTVTVPARQVGHFARSAGRGAVRTGPGSCSVSALAWTDVAGSLPDDDVLVLLALDDGKVWPAVRDYGRWIYVRGAAVRQHVTP